MITINMWKGLVKWCSACFIFLCFCIMVPGAWAAHEVSISDIKANVSTNTPTRWNLDLQVEWKQPSMGTDILNGYLYKWNNSSTSLNSQDALYTSFSAGVDGTVDTNLDPPNVTKPAADFAAFDSGDVLYLHIITWYTDVAGGTGVRVSADVVYGPFMIDNTAPVGTVRIVDVNGNDITSTSDTMLYLQLSAAKDPITMYLSETPTKPATGASYSANPVWNLINTAPGMKTIYAWFEDSVGNVSKEPATGGVTLLSSVSISPNTATLDLAGTATQVFRVEGSSETDYVWSITDPVPVTQGDTVAEFSGVSTGNSITIKGLKKGTFKLRAVRTGEDLSSGTITVAQTVMLGDVDNNGVVNTFDVIKIARESLGLGNTGTFISAAADITGDGNINAFDVIKAARLSLGLSI